MDNISGLAHVSRCCWTTNGLSLTAISGMENQGHISMLLCYIPSAGKEIQNETLRITIPVVYSLMKSHLESSAQFWSPHFKKGMAALEKLQEEGTKMIRTEAPSRGKNFSVYFLKGQLSGGNNRGLLCEIFRDDIFSSPLNTRSVKSTDIKFRAGKCNSLPDVMIVTSLKCYTVSAFRTGLKPNKASCC